MGIAPYLTGPRVFVSGTPRGCRRHPRPGWPRFRPWTGTLRGLPVSSIPRRLCFEHSMAIAFQAFRGGSVSTVPRRLRCKHSERVGPRTDSAQICGGDVRSVPPARSGKHTEWQLRLKPESLDPVSSNLAEQPGPPADSFLLRPRSAMVGGGLRWGNLREPRLPPPQRTSERWPSCTPSPRRRPRPVSLEPRGWWRQPRPPVRPRQGGGHQQQGGAPAPIWR